MILIFPWKKSCQATDHQVFDPKTNRPDTPPDMSESYGDFY